MNPCMLKRFIFSTCIFFRPTYGYIQKCCSNNSKENLADVFSFSCLSYLSWLKKPRTAEENFVERWIQWFRRIFHSKNWSNLRLAWRENVQKPMQPALFQLLFQVSKQLLIKAPPVQYYDRKKAMKAMNDSLKMWPIFRCRN